MFREMRRKEKQLSEEKIVEILIAGEEGVLATVGKDGYPYAVPVNYVFYKDCIYFHSTTIGHKIDNMAYNSKVSFCVLKDTQLIPQKFSTKFKSVILFGTAQEVFDEEKKDGLLALVKRLSGDHIKAGEKYIKSDIDKTKVFKINIDHQSGKGTE